MNRLRPKRILASARRHFRNLRYTVFHRISTTRVVIGFSQKSSNPEVFSLDLHTSVLRDVQPYFDEMGVAVNRWSISASSAIFSEPNLKVAHINSRTWQNLNSDLVKAFQSRYHRTLAKSSGYVVTHSMSFVEIFAKFSKPMLAINSTRYESPYTLKPKQIQNLNTVLQRNTLEGCLTIISNNLGDRDYLHQMTGIDTIHIPSLCAYTQSHTGGDPRWMVLSRNTDLSLKVAKNGNYIHSMKELFPQGYSYTNLARIGGVILIPYNISTMTLFELSTAGIPVRIPSDKLLLEWIGIPGVLSELSYVQVLGVQTPSHLKGTMADPNTSGFYEWWLARADWRDSTMFPNITFFDSLDELEEPTQPVDYASVAMRNMTIRNRWQLIISNFVNELNSKPF